MRRKLAAGNWKMNGTLAGLDMLADVAAAMDSTHAEAVICPPAPYLLPAVTKAQGTPVGIGAQHQVIKFAREIATADDADIEILGSGP